MSYNKLGFTSGQKLMADHLNHMEDGIANAGGTFVLRPTAEELQEDGGAILCTTQYDELAKALENGHTVKVILSANSIGSAADMIVTISSWGYSNGMIVCGTCIPGAALTLVFVNGTYVPTM